MQRSLFLRWFVCVALVLAIGCTGDDPPEHGHHDAASAGDAGHVDAGVADASTAADAAPPMPGTPVLLSASVVMHGTMAVAWRNPDSTCATVQINRKMVPGEYAVSQTLTGQATAAQDSPGHANGTYCYTITCRLSGFSSDPSNEICVTQ